MVTIDGKWMMEGLEYDDDKRIKSSDELTEYINKIGFLPLFKNNIAGFSVEEITSKYGWWSDKPEEDPWAWREVIAAEGFVAYGKLFSGKAGFVSKEWYPLFASYRRDGYDFDSRYEDGLASRKSKNIIDVLSNYESLPSYELKALAGFSKGGEKGFDGALNSLQMLTYITVRDFKKKRNKKNEEYGWSVASYSLSENLFGEDYIRSGYKVDPKVAKDKIIRHLLGFYPDATYDEIERCIR